MKLETAPKAKLLLVVAAALIRERRVLIAQRPEGKRLAGLWEFPGGKLEPNESPEAGLGAGFAWKPVGGTLRGGGAAGAAASMAAAAAGAAVVYGMPPGGALRNGGWAGATSSAVAAAAALPASPWSAAEASAGPPGGPWL